MAIQPVKLVCADGQTTIAEKTSRLQRHVAQTATQWAGTQAEYEQWAEDTLHRYLANIGQHVSAVPVTLFSNLARKQPAPNPQPRTR